MVTVGKIIFNEDNKEHWQFYSKSIQFYLAVLNFDTELRNLAKYQNIELIDIAAVRAMLHKHLEDKGVSLEMLS